MEANPTIVVGSTMEANPTIAVAVTESGADTVDMETITILDITIIRPIEAIITAHTNTPTALTTIPTTIAIPITITIPTTTTTAEDLVYAFILGRNTASSPIPTARQLNPVIKA